MPLSGAVMLPFLMVKVSDVEPPTATAAAPKPFAMVGGATGWTTCSTTFDGPLGRYTSSPSYTAVMECVPAGNDTIVKIVCPDPLIGWEPPSGNPPFMRCTYPVGVAVAGLTGLTVAVKATAPPTFDGLGVDVSCTVAFLVGVTADPAFTVWT